MLEHRVNTNAPCHLADYLPTVFPRLTRGMVYRFGKEKKIRCNGTHITGADRIKTGDLLALYLSPELLEQPTGPVYLLARDELQPVYEDDALLAFDDRRMAAAMELLQELAQRRQILLFTCQRREGAYLAQKPGVTRAAVQSPSA